MGTLGAGIAGSGHDVGGQARTARAAGEVRWHDAGINDNSRIFSTVMTGAVRH